MRIVIDLQGAQTESRFRGIGRYSLSLAKAIIRNKADHEVLIALNGLFPESIELIRDELNGLLDQENIRVWYSPSSINGSVQDNAWRRKVAEVIREAFLESLQPDIIHITSFFEGYIDNAVTSIGAYDKKSPVTVSLYDLIPLLNAEKYLDPNPIYAEYYNHKIEYLHKSALLLAISKASCIEGRDNLQLADSEIINISTASSDEFHQVSLNAQETEQLLSKHCISSPFLLYTGGADDRKNLPRLIEAYSQLSLALREKHQLVFAGKISEAIVQLLKKKALLSGLNKSELVFVGYISDPELIQMYSICKLFVFPSCHEGFGLPVLEAMKCGAPVIGSNRTSIPEVIGAKEALFDPYDANDMCRKIARALEDEDFIKFLVENGIKQSKKFSWDKCAELTISAFEEVHNGTIENNDSLRKNSHETLVSEIAKILPENVADSELALIAESVAYSRMSEDFEKRNLFVDISELVERDSRTGVQRVTRSLLEKLLSSPPAGYIVTPVYGSQNGRGYRCAKKYTANFLNNQQGDTEDHLVEHQVGDIFLGLDLQHYVTCANHKHLERLRRDGVKVLFVIYDLLPILMPQNFWSDINVAHQKWLEVITKFDGAICISQSVENELNEWLKLNNSSRERPFLTSWFHLGADINNSRPSQGLMDNTNDVLKALESKPSFLSVGTIEPRKGQEQVLNAFEKLWSQGVNINLVLVGKQGWQVEAFIARLKSHDERGVRLFWLNGISDEYLEKVYQACTCLIASSEGEGFGLPLIEAGQHKLPIIARDIPVFREVAGKFAYYYDGEKPLALVATVNYWLTQFELNQHPASDSMPWLTWEESALQLLEKIGITNTETKTEKKNL